MDDFWVPGLDVSGHIAEVGRKVEKWKVGDRVLCHGNMFRPCEGFAEFTVQDAETLIPHPDLRAEIAAATPCAGWTAWRALNDKLRAHEHNSILITGGSGGVGGFATQTPQVPGCFYERIEFSTA
jgi:NADPH:quinone reductase-like Zn-dependent oxidoreductase